MSKPAPLEVAAAEYSTRHGRHYRAHLQASGMSQAALARELSARHGLTDAAWEMRLKNFPGLVSPSSLTLAALADHFGVKMESFAAPLEGKP